MATQHRQHTPNPASAPSTKGLSVQQSWCCLAALYLFFYSDDLIFYFTWGRLLFLILYTAVLFIGMPLAHYTAPRVPAQNRSPVRRAVDFCGYYDADWFRHSKMAAVFCLAWGLPLLVKRDSQSNSEGDNTHTERAKTAMHIVALVVLIGLIFNHWWSGHEEIMPGWASSHANGKSGHMEQIQQKS